MNVSDALYGIAVRALAEATLSTEERESKFEELAKLASARNSCSRLRHFISGLAHHIQEAESDTGGESIQDYTQLSLQEADAVALVEKGIAPVTVIRPGFNTSKTRFYKEDTLARDHKVFEGAKMFLDHGDPFSGTVRSVKDWAASLKNVRVGPDGAIVGEAVVVDPGFRQKLKILKESGLLGEMGVSINAYAKAKEEQIEGVNTLGINAILGCESVDFVSFPGAGGGVRAYENAPRQALKNLTLEDLEKDRPDLVRQIREAKGDTPMDEKDVQKALEAKDSEIASLKADLAKVKGEDEFTKITAAKEAAEKEAETLKSQVAELEAKTLASQIQGKLAESKLPEASVKRLQERSYTSLEEAEAQIKAEAEYLKTLGVAPVREAGAVYGFGPSNQDVDPNKKVDLVATFQKLGLNESQAKFAASM